MMLGGGGGGGGRCLFTATQWQELEHQALIYRYMAAGAPVPPDLLRPLRHRSDVDTVPSLAFPPHQPSLGWGCYGAAAAAAQYGRRTEDPEPGRCRRTDGKKWRCSREAHGDSKYCEKHMHRGKNRSRKPVEMAPAAAAVYRPSALSISPPAPDAPNYGGGGGHLHLIRLDAASARAPSNQTGPLLLHLDAFQATSPPPSYHRYAHATSLLPSGYGGWSKERDDAVEARRRRRQQQHCLALGADLTLDSAEKPLRRFINEWPAPRDVDGNNGRPWDSTQLSISIPTATGAASPPDLAVAAAASHFNNDE